MWLQPGGRGPVQLSPSQAGWLWEVVSGPRSVPPVARAVTVPLGRVEGRRPRPCTAEDTGCTWRGSRGEGQRLQHLDLVGLCSWAPWWEAAGFLPLAPAVEPRASVPAQKWTEAARWLLSGCKVILSPLWSRGQEQPWAGHRFSEQAGTRAREGHASAQASAGDPNSHGASQALLWVPCPWWTGVCLHLLGPPPPP